MNNKPTVQLNPKTNEVLTEFTGSDNVVYYRIRVDQTQEVISGNMVRLARRSVLITLTEEMKDLYEAKGVLKAGAEWKVAGKSGQLIVKESHMPFYEGQEPKTKGVGGEVILSGGKPVYRDTLFTLDMDAKDELLFSDSSITEPTPTDAKPAQPANAQPADATANGATE